MIIAIERAFPQLALPQGSARGPPRRQGSDEAHSADVGGSPAVSLRMKKYCTKPLRDSYFSYQLLVAA